MTVNPDEQKLSAGMKIYINQLFDHLRTRAQTACAHGLARGSEALR